MRALSELHGVPALGLLLVPMSSPERFAVEAHLHGAAVRAKPELVVPVLRGQQCSAPRRRPLAIESDLLAKRHRGERGVETFAVGCRGPGIDSEKSLRGAVHGPELGGACPPPVLCGLVALPLEEGRPPGRLDGALENDAVVTGGQAHRRLGERFPRRRAQDLAPVHGHASGGAEGSVSVVRHPQRGGPVHRGGEARPAGRRLSDGRHADGLASGSRGEGATKRSPLLERHAVDRDDRLTHGSHRRERRAPWIDLLEVRKVIGLVRVNEERQVSVGRECERKVEARCRKTQAVSPRRQQSDPSRVHHVSGRSDRNREALRPFRRDRRPFHAVPGPAIGRCVGTEVIAELADRDKHRGPDRQRGAEDTCRRPRPLRRGNAANSPGGLVQDEAREEGEDRDRRGHSVQVRRFNRHDQADEPGPEPKREKEETCVPDLRRRGEESQERKRRQHRRKQRLACRPALVLVRVTVEDAEGMLDLRRHEPRGAPFRMHVGESLRIVRDEDGRLLRAHGKLSGMPQENEEKGSDGKK